MSPLIEDLLADARQRLAAAPFNPPTREALLLLGRVLELDEAQVLARSREPVPPSAARRFESLLARRLTGEPVAYLLAEREFFGRTFVVDSRVLIPRPETEHLVECALAEELAPAPRILDVGAGSGCIGVTLALEIPDSTVVAVDLSTDALAVAAVNASRHRVTDRFHPVATDLVAGIDLRRFDLVVSNPPYVGPDEAEGLSPEVRNFEPPGALFAPDHGLSLLERLVGELAPLAEKTPLLLEIGQGQDEQLRGLVEDLPFEISDFRCDYADIPRVAILRRR